MEQQQLLGRPGDQGINGMIWALLTIDAKNIRSRKALSGPEKNWSVNCYPDSWQMAVSD